VTDTAARALLDTTHSLTSISSVSGDEAAIADYTERWLRAVEGMDVIRHGNTVVARSAGPGGTGTGRLILAGHLDTVAPTDPAQPVEQSGGEVRGRGVVDMKGGLAVLLHLARHEVPRAGRPCTIVCYDREELGSHGSGMAWLVRHAPDLLSGDAGVLLEPTGGWIEPGCQGSLRVRATFTGVAAHTARPWRGVNAIARSLPALTRCVQHVAPEVELDGLRYRQSFEVVAVRSAPGGNVVPDRCEIEVNARYAPSRGRDEVLAEITELLAGADDLTVTLDSPAAAPRLDSPVLAPLYRYPGTQVRPKLGWTDVGRLAQLGVPAVNFGPGDPELAHGPEERVTGAELRDVYDRLAEVLR
jgi:succinyl-diaminopimelate desuccinylase